MKRKTTAKDSNEPNKKMRADKQSKGISPSVRFLRDNNGNKKPNLGTLVLAFVECLYVEGSLIGRTVRSVREHVILLIGREASVPTFSNTIKNAGFGISKHTFPEDKRSRITSRPRAEVQVDKGELEVSAIARQIAYKHLIEREMNSIRAMCKQT